MTFGLAVLGEGVRLGWTDALGMLVSGAIAVGGVVILSKYHPDAQHNRPTPTAAAPEALDVADAGELERR